MRALLSDAGDGFELLFDGAIWRDIGGGSERSREYRHEPRLARVFVGHPSDAHKAVDQLRDVLERAIRDVNSWERPETEISLNA